MGINNLFNIGVTGVNTHGLAIEVTGENITNVNTPGYARQVAILETAQTNISSGFALGTGVKIAAVQRSYDALLQKQIVDGNSSYQQGLARQQAMQQVEPLFNELSSDGLGKTIEDYFGAWHDLTLNPQGVPERQALLTRAGIMVDAFHQTSASLQDVQKNADVALTGITADISDKAKNLASLNVQILETEHLGVNANELRDQRDLLVRQLAEKVGVTATEKADGSLRITLPANTAATSGQTLVDGGDYATLYADDAGGTTLNDIYVTATGNPPSAANPAADTKVTASIGGPNDAGKAPDNSLGQIGGTLQVRDAIVPDIMGQLDDLASTLGKEVNALHSAGFGLKGTTGDSFFSPAATAATIAVNPAIKADQNRIAAAKADPAAVGNGTGDNRQAIELADLGTAGVAFSSVKTSFGNFYSSLVSNVGIRTQDATNAVNQRGAFLRQLNNLRESNSGVSLDEELTNLIRYQKAYEGSARLISTATQMLDTVLGMIR